MKTLMLVVSFVGWAAVVQAQSFDVKPSLIFAAAKAADQITTYRFLHNGSGCTEANPRYSDGHMGRMALGNTIAVGAVIGGSWILTKVTQKQWPARVLGYAMAGIAAKSSIRNVHQCGW